MAEDLAEPEVPITETPEFEMALAAKGAEIQAQISAEMDAKLAKIMANAGMPAAAGDDAMSMARMIATAIGEMNQQGTGRKVVSPAVMEARRAAEKKMADLLLAARDLPKSDRPKYRLITSGYFKDRLVHPFHRVGKDMVPTDIYFMSSPSMGMRPLNKSAKAIFSAFMGSISNGESEVPFNVKPIWVTDSGVVIAGTPPRSAEAHGRVMEIDDAIEIDAMDGVPPAVGDGRAEDDDLSFVDQNDPRNEAIHVLGTIAQPAKRTAGLGLGDKRI